MSGDALPTLPRIRLSPEEENARKRLLPQEHERVRKTPRNGIGVSLWTMHVALAIVSLTGTTFELSADWLQRRRRRGVLLPQNVSRQELINHLQNIVLATSPEMIANWSDMHMCPNKMALAEATRFVRRRQLRDSVYCQNVRQGKPVTSQDVLALYNSFNSQESVSGSILPTLPNYLTVPSAPRVWVARWRKASNVGIGTIRPGESISLLEKRIKELFFL